MGGYDQWEDKPDLANQAGLSYQLPKRVRQEDCKFKADLDSRVRSRRTKVT